MQTTYMTIGKKIWLGFLLLLALITLISTMSFVGVNGIVHNASQVIDGKKLDGELAQREVDQLVWAEKVSTLLTDDEPQNLKCKPTIPNGVLASGSAGKRAKNS